MTGPLVLTHPASFEHLPPGHPERPERIAAIEAALRAPEFAVLRREQLDLGAGGPAAAHSAAASVHDPGHVDAMFEACAAAEARGLGEWLDADTYVGPGTLSAAASALLSARAAVDRVAAGEANLAFSLCRPPGHHATTRQAMGFCLFNSVAAAAQSALDAGMAKVAIVDFDVHHGNGTQDIFYARPDVLYISTHQWPLYPGTGAADERGSGDGEGFTLNLPMPAGTGDDGYLEVFDSAVIPALHAFRPELLLVSAGYDAHRGDPLAGMKVSTEGFAALTDRLMEASAELCEGRSAWVLEGGYDLEGLSTSVAATLRRAIASS